MVTVNIADNHTLGLKVEWYTLVEAEKTVRCARFILDAHSTLLSEHKVNQVKSYIQNTSEIIKYESRMVCAC